MVISTKGVKMEPTKCPMISKQVNDGAHSLSVAIKVIIIKII